MSLRQAIEEIAEGLEISTKESPLGAEAMVILKQVVMSLNIALRASESETPRSQAQVDSRTKELFDKAVARQEAKGTAAPPKEESGSTRMTELVGGKEEGDYVETDSNMPVGARCFQADGIYQLREDRKLHFDKEATEKYKEQRGK